jgi:hypothetical protein
MIKQIGEKKMEFHKDKQQNNNNNHQNLNTMKEIKLKINMLICEQIIIDEEIYNYK